MLRVTDLDAFSTFMRLVAGRTGQEERLTDLGGDAGVTHPTARSWLSVLEASFILFRVPAWHSNLRKRTVKSAKLHLVDSGVACQLLGIREPAQLVTHPLRGAIFESWVASEVLKARLHRGRPADLFHLREARGLEVDLIVEAERRVLGVEAKSGATLASDFFPPLRGFLARASERLPHLRPEARLVFGGEEGQTRHDVRAIPWSGIQDVAWE